jgi:hypothetical protein
MFTTTAQQQLIKTAIKGRWPIRPSVRVKIIDETERILDNNPDDKLKLLAARTIVQIDALNLREEELKQSMLPKHHIHTNMTTEELQVAIKEKLASLNLSELPEENRNVAVTKYLEYKAEGRIG